MSRFGSVNEKITSSSFTSNWEYLQTLNKCKKRLLSMNINAGSFKTTSWFLHFCHEKFYQLPFRDKRVPPQGQLETQYCGCNWKTSSLRERLDCFTSLSQKMPKLMWHRHATETSKRHWPLNNLFVMHAKTHTSVRVLLPCMYTHTHIHTHTHTHKHLQWVFKVSKPQIQTSWCQTLFVRNRHRRPATRREFLGHLRLFHSVGGKR